MERLIDFLNHGILPFTGRSQDVDRIVSFWRGTFDAQGMRAALLVGEAGIGKSRLLDETLPGIAAAGGAVIQAKLVPESTSSPLSLIAQGLWYSEAARRLVKVEPEPTHAAVAAGLRRVARLRPTLLVLEDIHLLAGDALRELSALLEAISSETFSLLCLARPVELPARAILERFLVDEIELGELTAAGIEEIWRGLFEDLPAGEVIERLREATGGNPLALRSALRSAVTSKTIARDPVSGRWSTSLDPEAFGRSLRRNVDLLIAGMAVHLDPEEERSAARIATLGELFAPESAAALIEDAPRMLAALTFKGIVAPAPMAPPLVGAPSDAPYTFTHTLLHQYLVASAPPPVGELIATIAAGLPVYSAIPFQLISRHDIPASVPHATLVDVVRRSIDVARRLDQGPDWTLTDGIVATCWHLFRALEQGLAGDELDPLKAELLFRTLVSLRRSIAGEEFERVLRMMLEFTEPLSDGPLAHYRLRALHQLHMRTAIIDYAGCAGVWDRVEELLERRPELFGGVAYLQYLQEVARAAQRGPDPAMLRNVEARLEMILASRDLPEELREMARQRVAPALLLLFETAEELERRKALLRDLPAAINGTNAALELNRIALLETTGWMEEALEAAGRAAPRFLQIGMAHNAAHVELIMLCARAALGADLDQILREAIRMAGEPGYYSSPAFRRNIGIYLAEIGLFAGELSWTRRVAAEFGPEASAFWPEGELLLAIDEGALAEALGRIDPTEEPIGSLAAIGAALAGTGPAGAKPADADAITSRVAALLARPLLRLDDIILRRALLAMLDGAATMEEEAKAPSKGTPRRSDLAGGELRGHLRAALEQSLTWLEERRLAPPALTLLDRHGALLPRKEATAWRTRLRALGGVAPSDDAGTRKLRIGMLGTISVTTTDGDSQQLRGARLRTMLGLLVAARMVREPLTNREFSRLAAGGETDPDLAKKTAIMAAARLREAIGAEAVLTGEETYMLNLDRVSVDLLEAHELIAEARDALRRRALMRAYPALLRALELTRGEVPFPGLYDDFFEAIREDFDYTLRSTVIDVAQALLRESDPTSAAELLRLAFDGMPDDEELMELLRDTLAASGRRADAERARMRAEEVLEPAERF